MDEFTLEDGRKPETPAPMFGCNQRKFKWKIKAVSKIPRNDNKRKISAFFKVDPLSTWHAEFSRGLSYFSFYIVRDNVIFNITVLFQLTSSYSAGKTIYKNFGKIECDSYVRECDLIDSDIYNCMYDLLKALNDEFLFTVYLEVTPSVSQYPLTISPPPQNLLQSLPIDVKSILNKVLETATENPSEDMANIVARSYLMGRALTSDNAENESNSSSLQELTNFMDSEMLKHMDEYTTVLFYHIAHRNAMLDLKEKCRQSLLSELKEDNIDKIFDLMI